MKHHPMVKGSCPNAATGIGREKMPKMITIFYKVNCEILYIENHAEIFPVHYTWKVAEKGFKMAFMMNKLAMINSCEKILEK
jgi:hypothetical protein